MNQRREPRIPTNQSVEITIFGRPDQCMPGVVRNMSARGVAVELEAPLATGAALKISMEDAFFLGEVIYCREQQGKWYAGVEIEHALCGLAELATSLRAFNEEYLGVQRPDSVQYARGQHK